ncbi:MAG: Co2+/Mg2+ efflux protein ApaG [Alphaproteobacteria bacterium]
MTNTYERITRDIRVAVEPSFLESHSDPEENRFFWAYHIVIENQGRDTVQLLTRHWLITDAQGRVQEVKGAGVVGEQPVLKPATRFEYTSGVPLETPTGFMTGSYRMRSAAGEDFDIAIPTFALESPYETGRIH